MAKQTNVAGREVYIVDGSRTPFLKARGQPGKYKNSEGCQCDG